MDSSTTQDIHWIRRIVLFMGGQTISLFGSSLVQFAIMWYVAKETNSGVMVTLSTIAAFVPQVFISLFAGVWADRYNRKLLIIAADAMIAVSTLVLALLMSAGYQQMWMLMLISAVRSAGAGVQTPAVSAMIPQMVPEEKLMRVGGLQGSLGSMVNLVAPIVGGGVLSAGPLHSILYIDVVTAAIGISLLCFVRIPARKQAVAAEKKKALADLGEGMRYAWTHFFVRRLLALYVAFTVLIVPAAFLNVLMVRRVFGDTYWHLTWNEVCFFVGAVAGGLILSAWGGFKNRLMTLAVGTMAFGALTVVIGLVSNFGVYLIVIGITGVTMAAMNTPVTVLIQEKVEPDKLGRVFSLVQIVFSTFMPLGMAAFGPLADVIPIQTLMIISGVALIGLSLVMMNDKSFMREGLRPALENAVEAE